MRYSENLHLNLPEDSDPLEIDKISENFEVLDGAVKEQSKASGYQVGDTLTTWRTDLGEEWLLCNGDILRAEDYPDLRKITPGITANIYNDLYNLGPGIPNPHFAHKDFLYNVTGPSNDFKITIKVYNVITLQETAIELDAAYNNSFYTFSWAGEVDGILYFFSSFKNKNNTSGKLALLRCDGDPTARESWSLFEQISETPSFDNIVFVEIKSPEQFWCYGNNKKIFKYAIFNNNLVFEDSIALPKYAEWNSIPFETSNSFILNNKLYSIGTNSQQKKVFLFSLNSDATEWIGTELYEYDFNHTPYSFSYSVYGLCVSNDVAMFFFAASSRPDANNGPYIKYSGFFEVDGDGNILRTDLARAVDNGSAFSKIDSLYPNNSVISSMISTAQNLRFIAKYAGKYYFPHSSNGLFILDEISTEVLDRLSAKDAVPVTSFSKNSSLKGNITSSDDVFIAPLGGVPYRFPVMCTPAISHSTTYTYIKAKEDNLNANQQTDTPAP